MCYGQDLKTLKPLILTLVDGVIDDVSEFYKEVFASKDYELKRLWLKYRDVKTDELDGALLSYLIPCYLTAFIESNNGDSRSNLFFSSVLQLLLMKSSRLLERPVEVPVRDSADFIAQTWELQNKVYI
jgi:hypothetical protein